VIKLCFLCQCLFAAKLTDWHQQKRYLIAAPTSYRPSQHGHYMSSICQHRKGRQALHHCKGHTLQDSNTSVMLHATARSSTCESGLMTDGGSTVQQWQSSLQHEASACRGDAPLPATDELLTNLQVLCAPQAAHHRRVAALLARAAQAALQEGQHCAQRHLQHTPQCEHCVEESHAWQDISVAVVVLSERLRCNGHVCVCQQREQRRDASHPVETSWQEHVYQRLAITRALQQRSSISGVPPVQAAG